MLTPLRTPFLLVGVVGLCAACHEITTADQSEWLRVPSQSILAAGGAPGAAQICHRTNGTTPFLLLRVSGNAVDAHLAHGDHLAITYYRIGSPTDTIVACAPPPGYSESPNDCAPVFSFTDAFDGASLDPEWLLVNGTDAPQLCSGEACGEVQSGAYRTCVGQASSQTVSFDFHTDGVESREVWAMFSSGEPFDTGSSTYILGCDGGFSDAANNATCGLTIDAIGGPDAGRLVSAIDAGLQVGVAYRLVAIASATGALTVDIYQGSTLMASREAQAGGPISVSNVGFITGRATDGFLTYIDNFSFTSAP